MEKIKNIYTYDDNDDGRVNNLVINAYNSIDTKISQSHLYCAINYDNIELAKHLIDKHKLILDNECFNIYLKKMEYNKQTYKSFTQLFTEYKFTSDNLKTICSLENSDLIKFVLNTNTINIDFQVMIFLPFENYEYNLKIFLNYGYMMTPIDHLYLSLKKNEI
jgi:hypothetical protein